MTQTVFDNDMTAHAWAHGNGEARSHNGNLFARGAVLFSYGTHFPIGVRIPRDGAPVFILNADSYSVTTTGHQSRARRAAHGEVVRLPALGDVWRDFNAIAEGRANARHKKALRDHLERPNVGAVIGPESVAVILRLIGSRADPVNVTAKAEKKAKAEKAARDKRQRDSYVQIARRAVAAPLSAFDGSGRAIEPNHLGTHTLERAPTELARAWRAAKVSGWSQKRLKALRQREKALRDNLEKVNRRARRERSNEQLRRIIAKTRELANGKPLALAMESGSLPYRIELARWIRSLYVFQPATLSTPLSKWEALNDWAGDLSSKAQSIRGRVRDRVQAHERANALELWRAGELDHGRLPREFRRYSGALLRAIHVTRDESGAITGGELQTSGGARVPLTRAILLFRFLKALRARMLPETETAWTRNGSRAVVGAFEVDAIYGDGSFKAGCHFIRWSESRALAESLGVFDVTPSADIVRDSARA